MAFTSDFRETIRARVERDPKFRKQLLREGIEFMLRGDIATGKIILRDYINATVGFTELAQATHIPSKSLMRMLGPAGNPCADNLFKVVSFLQRREGVRFHLKITRGRAMNKKNVGTPFDSWLQEEGMYERVKAAARKRVIERHVETSLLSSVNKWGRQQAL